MSSSIVGSCIHIFLCSKAPVECPPGPKPTSDLPLASRCFISSSSTSPCIHTHQRSTAHMACAACSKPTAHATSQPVTGFTKSIIQESTSACPSRWGASAAAPASAPVFRFIRDQQPWCDFARTQKLCPKLLCAKPACHGVHQKRSQKEPSCLHFLWWVFISSSSMSNDPFIEDYLHTVC